MPSWLPSFGRLIHNHPCDHNCTTHGMCLTYENAIHDLQGGDEEEGRIWWMWASRGGTQTSGNVAEGRCPSLKLFSTLSSTTLNVFLCLEGGMFSLSPGHHTCHCICPNWSCITSFWNCFIETQSLPLHLVLSMADFLLQWQTGVVVTENLQLIKPQVFAMPPFFQKKLANFCSRSVLQFSGNRVDVRSS